MSLARRLQLEDDQDPTGGSEAAGGCAGANGLVSWLDISVKISEKQDNMW